MRVAALAHCAPDEIDCPVVARPMNGAPGGVSHHNPLLRRILTRFSREVGAERFERYFDTQIHIGLTDGQVDITAPTGFMAELLDRRFGEPLKRAAAAELSDAGSPPVQVRFRVDEEAPANPGHIAPAPTAPHAGESGGGAPSRQAAAPRDAGTVARRVRARSGRRTEAADLRYRLDDFVVGESNRLAYTTALRLTEPDGPRQLSPLFVHGGCGLGKTHLLQGIAARYLELHPDSQVRYITAEAFTNEYITAVRTNTIDAFRKASRRVDLLCIDDVHFVSNKQATQTELLHTFDTIDLGGARVVLASDEHPRHIQRLSEALVSRFMAGMVVRLDPPDAALCDTIVRRLAERRGLLLDDAAVRSIVGRCLAAAASNRGADPGGTGAGGGGGSIRELEGMVNRVDAVARLLPELRSGNGRDEGGRVGALLVSKALGHGGRQGDGMGTPSAARRAAGPIKIELIAGAVCRELRVDMGDFFGRGRHKRVVLARTLTAHLGRLLTTMSYPEIAKAMARPNHSTIVTACQRFTAQLGRDEVVNVGCSYDGLRLADVADQLGGLILRSVATGP